MRNTRAIIDLSRLERNYHRLREAHRERRILTVLKANAYGHGMIPAARFLAGLGQDLFGVAILDEALELREAGIEGRILVLSPPELERCAAYATHGIEMTVASLEHLLALAHHPDSRGQEIHLKLDTGMGRVGLRPEELPAAREALARAGGMRLRAVYSHFAEAENLGSAFCEEQHRAFEAGRAELLREVPGEAPELHLSNSAGLLRDARFHYDYARVGYALWAPLLFGAGGAGSTPEPAVNRELEAVMTLRTTITHLKTMSAGDSVGYGRTYRCRAGERIATLPIGYGDGYFRQMSNVGFVQVAGRRHPIVGTVSMDQTTISLGVEEDAVEAAVGDEVILLGGDRDGHPGIPVVEAAGWLKTIDYEVLTQLSTRIPRLYLHREREVVLT